MTGDWRSSSWEPVGPAVSDFSPWPNPIDIPAGPSEALGDPTEPADDTPDSWSPIDLGPYLRGEVQRSKPTIGLTRRDGLRLLYPGKEHAVIGEMESGKTWFACACVAAELEAGNHVLYIHFEEPDPSDIIGRLLDLGIRDETINRLLRFVAPQRKVNAEDLARLLEPVPSLMVLDGVNEAMGLHRWAIREEEGAADFRRYLVMPGTRVGAAVLSCDHVVKDVERRGRFAIGSIHKGNGLTGSLILLENAEPFGRKMRGRSHVFATKDRPGFLRSNGEPTKTPGKTFLGELVVDDTRTFVPFLELSFFAPADKSKPEAGAPHPQTEARRAAKDEADQHVLAVVAALRSEQKMANLNAVVARSDYGKGKTSEALDRLVLDGKLTEARDQQQRVFNHRSE